MNRCTRKAAIAAATQQQDVVQRVEANRLGQPEALGFWGALLPGEREGFFGEITVGAIHRKRDQIVTRAVDWLDQRNNQALVFSVDLASEFIAGRVKDLGVLWFGDVEVEELHGDRVDGPANDLAPVR